MKHVILASALAMFATTAGASGLSDPVVAPTVIADAATASAGSDEWVLIMMTLLVFGTALTQ